MVIATNNQQVSLRERTSDLFEFPTNEHIVQQILCGSPEPEIVAQNNQIWQVAQRNQLPLVPVMNGYHFSEPKFFPAKSAEAHDWVFLQLYNHPQMSDPDGFPIPPQQLADINRVLEAGVDFSSLYIADELPAGTIAQSGGDLAKMLTPPASQKSLEQSSKIGSVANTVLNVMSSVARVPGQVANAGLQAGGVAMDLLGSMALVGLDPIIFGTTSVSTKPGAPCTFWVVTMWKW